METINITIEEYCHQLDKNVTYCYELTTPYNRIVVYYPDCKVTLLAARDITTFEELDIKSIKQSVPVVSEYPLQTLDDIVNYVNEQNPISHEGVVVKDSSFNRIKVKNINYVYFNRCRDVLGTSYRAILSLILNEKDDDVVPFMPQEIVDDIKDIKVKLAEFIARFNNQYNDIMNKYNVMKQDNKYVSWSDRKIFASVVNEFAEWKSPMFDIYMGKSKNINEYIASRANGGEFPNSILDMILEHIGYDMNNLKRK